MSRRKDLEVIDITLPGLPPDHRQHIDGIIKWEKRNLRRGWAALVEVLGPIAQRQLERAKRKREDNQQ